MYQYYTKKRHKRQVFLQTVGFPVSSEFFSLNELLFL